MRIIFGTMYVRAMANERKNTMKKLLSLCLVVALCISMSASVFANDTPEEEVIPNFPEKGFYITKGVPAGTVTPDTEPVSDKFVVVPVKAPKDEDSIALYGVCPATGGNHPLEHSQKSVHRVYNSTTCHFMTALIIKCKSCTYYQEGQLEFVDSHPRSDPYCPNYNGGRIIG